MCERSGGRGSASSLIITIIIVVDVDVVVVDLLARRVGGSFVVVATWSYADFLLLHMLTARHCSCSAVSRLVAVARSSYVCLANVFHIFTRFDGATAVQQYIYI